MMEAAIHVKPFGFDRVFHAGAAAPEVDAAELSEQIEDLQARIAAMEIDHFDALAHARTEAFHAGLEQARHDREAALLAATDAIHAALDEIDARFAAVTDRYMHDAADVALVAAEMLAGHALDQSPLRAVDEALSRVLVQVARGTRLTVRINPDQLDDMERLIVERQSAERRRLAITAVPDAAIVAGSAAITWDEGGLSVDAAARRAAVVAELAPLLTQPTAQTK